MIINRENLEKKLSISDERLLVAVDEFRTLLPILTEECEGFCVDARELHQQLVINDTSKTYAGKQSEGDKFSQWITRRINKYEFEENVDYICISQKCETQRQDGQRGITIAKQYKLTMDMAKELAMIENNEIGKKARRYFIAMEKVVKLAIQWEDTRAPQKSNWKVLEKELAEHYMRTRNELPKTYAYQRESNTINKLVLGDTAKKVRAKVGANDDVTRDWLPEIYNQAIDYCQEQLIVLLKMDMDRPSRYDMVTRMFNAKYPTLRPYLEVYNEENNQAVA